MKNEFSNAELMAVEMSRHLKDGWLCIVGSASWVPFAACRLAQLTHAPNLNFLSGGGTALNPRGPIPSSVHSYETFKDCEAVLSLDEVFDIEENGSIDVFFAGGIQIDQYGALNLVSIGDYKKPKFRGPGTVGLVFLTTAKRTFIWTHTHDTRTFVKKVDFISAPGTIGKRSTLSQGPKLVISNLCVMDFDETSGKMRLKYLFPGVTVKEVRNKTGFELIIPEKVEEIKPPSDEEIKILRSEVDPKGVLKNL